MDCNPKKRLSHAVIFFFLFQFLYWLRNTDASYGVYILCAAAGAAAYADRARRGELSSPRRFNIGAAVFALAIALANSQTVFIDASKWKDFTQFQPVVRLYALATICAGGYLIADQIWNFFCTHFHAVAGKLTKDNEGMTVDGTKERRRLFGMTVLLTVGVGALYLFLMCYPGIVISDNAELFQFDRLDGYVDHYPVAHALLIRFFFRIGLRLFGSPNAGVATYTVFQIVVMAFIYAYVVMTLYDLKIRPAAIKAIICFYTLAPYNISYLCATWKDTLFAGSMLLMMAAVVRLEAGRARVYNGVLLFLGAFCAGLFRPNGFLAIAGCVVVIGLLFLFQKDVLRWKKICLPLLIAVLFAGVVKYPVMRGLGVLPTESSESLSVPIQQIARVIVNGKELKPEETRMIDELIPVDDVARLYEPSTSDPIKGEIGNHPALRENAAGYFRLWLDIGLRYPADYLVAWAELTKGFWNAGYDTWICARGVSSNTLGIYETHPLDDYVYKLQSAFRIMPVLHLFAAIGLQMWIIWLLFCYQIKYRRRLWLAGLPLIMAWLTLLVSSPVALFRYIYVVFLALPLYLCAAAFEEGVKGSS